MTEFLLLQKTILVKDLTDLIEIWKATQNLKEIQFRTI